MVERLTGSRYVVPLREGGSLPAVVETASGGAFVVKFRGAGQGPKALVAELIVAELARAAGLAVPSAAIVSLDEEFGRAEPDPEIQDILRRSVGANFGLAFLPGALGFDPAADAGLLTPEEAAEIVWLDALTMNVDRSARNPNLLVWGDRVWVIDHGAALYLHHRWEGWEERIGSSFPQIRDHLLLAAAGDLRAADARLRARLTPDLLQRIVSDVPDAWLQDEPTFSDRAAQRAAYVAYLEYRLLRPDAWLQEAIDAQRRGPPRLAPRLTHRVV